MMISWWAIYQQFAVVVALFLSLATVVVAFRRAKMDLKTPFIVTLTWDFSRSWATNISGLAGIIGVTVVSTITTDFKPFAQAAVKNSYAATTILMAAVVVAAPSIYTLLQERNGNQLTGSVGGFLAASMLTIWGTMAQLLVQGALLVTFVIEKPSSRFALLLVPVILAVGLLLLFPYSIKSIQVAIINETQVPPTPPVKGMRDELDSKSACRKVFRCRPSRSGQEWRSCKSGFLAMTGRGVIWSCRDRVAHRIRPPGYLQLTYT